MVSSARYSNESLLWDWSDGFFAIIQMWQRFTQIIQPLASQSAEPLQDIITQVEEGYPVCVDVQRATFARLFYAITDSRLRTSKRKARLLTRALLDAASGAESPDQMAFSKSTLMKLIN